MARLHTTYSAVLGVVLTSLRKEKGVDQTLMAEKMGLTQASYSRLEGGNAIFSIDQSFQAASALGYSDEEIGARLNNTVSSLRANGVSVEPQVRGNTLLAKQGHLDGKRVVGAELAALLIGILSKR